MKKHHILTGLILLIVIAAVLLFRDSTDRVAVNTAPLADPFDVMLDFYDEWLLAASSTTTNPYDAGLHTAGLLTPAVQEKIQTLRMNEENLLDPVLCQPEPPVRIGAKELYNLNTEVQFMVLARGGEVKAANQAIVTLKAENGAWQITAIDCATGEIAPVRDFPFEQEGYILKSVPPPLNPEFWHLVFEQAGVMGHTVPLFFTNESVCIDVDGNESTCAVEQFKDATKVLVQADMTEAGAEVKRMHFLP